MFTIQKHQTFVGKIYIYIITNYKEDMIKSRKGNKNQSKF